MCGACDVLQSSYQSANAMTHTLCDYGDGNMGNGLRKFAGEMSDAGCKLAWEDGYSIGMFNGVIITTAVIGIVGLTACGIRKAIDKYRIKKEQEKLNMQNRMEREEKIKIQKYKVMFNG